MIGIPVEVPGTMKRTNTRLRFCVILLAMNLLFIWGNSLLDKPVSAGLSSWVLEELLGGLPWLSHTALRKLAHFVEFAVLGILLSWLLANKIKKTWAFALPTAVLGCLAACMDEMLQHVSFVKVVAWYDNEYGYSANTVNLLEYMDEMDHK